MPADKAGSDGALNMQRPRDRLEVSLQRPRNATYVLSVLGEIDRGNHQLLEKPLRSLLEDPEQRVIVDLSKCAFIDSTGIQVLVAARQAVATNGDVAAPLVVCGAHGQVRRVLELTGGAEAIPLFLTKQEALELVEPRVPAAAAEASRQELSSSSRANP
jgi:anti-sigma B factor antagonist